MIYCVEFEEHKYRQIRHYVFYCIAPNAKVACGICKYAWERYWDSHLFHLHASRVTDQNVDRLYVKSWKQREYNGSECLNRHIMLDFHAW